MSNTKQTTLSQLSINTDLTAPTNAQDAVNVINNTTKKVKVIAIGGGGRSIAEDVKTAVSKNPFITVPVEWNHVDTSYADIDENNENDFKVLMIGDGTGSGGILRTNATKAKAQEQEIKDLFCEKNTLYIVIAGASGGSSVLLQMITKISNGFPTLFVVSGSLTNNNAGENTLKNLKSLNHVSKQESIFLSFFDNGGRRYSDVNSEINTTLSALLLFWSDTVSLDIMDMRTFLTEDKLADNHKGLLYSVGIAVNDVKLENVSNIRELVIDGVKDGIINDIEGNDGKQGMTRNPVTLYNNVHKICVYAQYGQFTKQIQNLDDLINTRKLAEKEASETREVLGYQPNEDDLFL